MTEKGTPAAGKSRTARTVNSDEIPAWIDENGLRLSAIADAIWDKPELAHHEFYASKRQADYLEQAGFSIYWDQGGLSTAFCAEWGSGSPVIGFAGEYDALPGFSQARLPDQMPLEHGAPGHACGHNLLGTGALGAAEAVKFFLEANNLPGTVRYYGCPAEEEGSGKTYMIRAGAFSGVDAMFNSHPFFVNFASKGSVIGVRDLKFRFYGSPSHAGAAPHLGRSALDAVELMNVGVNYLREHVPSEVRMHYVITNGGKAPNIVPHEAEVWYYLRAYHPEVLADVAERVEKIARGATMMTDTRLEVIFNAGTTSMLNNRVLSDLQYASMERIGPIRFTDEELDFAARVNAAYPPDTAQAISSGYHIPLSILKSGDLVGENFPALDEGKVMSFSTDVGDLSWNVPLSILYTACFPTYASLHTWGVAAAVGTSIGHKGMLHAAKVMALSAAELFLDADLLAGVRAEFEDALHANPYTNPVPDEMQAPQVVHPLRNGGG